MLLVCAKTGGSSSGGDVDPVHGLLCQPWSYFSVKIIELSEDEIYQLNYDISTSVSTSKFLINVTF